MGCAIKDITLADFVEKKISRLLLRRKGLKERRELLFLYNKNQGEFFI